MTSVYTDEQIAQALKRSANRTLIEVCAELGCSRSMLANRISRSPELARLTDALAKRREAYLEEQKRARIAGYYEALEKPNEIICEIVRAWSGWDHKQTHEALARLSKAVKQARKAERKLGIGPRRLIYRRSC